MAAPMRNGSFSILRAAGEGGGAGRELWEGARCAAGIPAAVAGAIAWGVQVFLQHVLHFASG